MSGVTLDPGVMPGVNPLIVPLLLSTAIIEGIWGRDITILSILALLQSPASA